MPGDVVEQLEESKSLEQKDEHQHEYCEIREKSSEQIQIHQQRQAAAGCFGRVSLGAASVSDACRCCSDARGAHPNQAHPGLEAAERLEPADFAAELLHAREQRQSRK